MKSLSRYFLDDPKGHKKVGSTPWWVQNHKLTLSTRPLLKLPAIKLNASPHPLPNSTERI